VADRFIIIRDMGGGGRQTLPLTLLSEWSYGHLSVVPLQRVYRAVDRPSATPSREEVNPLALALIGQRTQPNSRAN